MNAHTSGNMVPANRLLRIFGLGQETGGNDATAEKPAEAAAPSDINPLKLARRELLDRVTNFLVDHDLAITPSNLVIAHSAFSGGNLALARKIAEREVARETIEQAWLDEAAREDQPDAGLREDLVKLAARIETSIERFGDSTRSARSAAADYNSELEKHVAEVGEAGASGAMLANIAELATAMLERSRQLEADMQRSERESDALRKSLAKAQREAKVDHLTGLPNRRAFEDLLETHYREAQAEIEPLCVAFCDIDHFKRVNDSHGHDTGDRVIQAIAQVLSQISGKNCHVARQGGEEFVMLFRGMSPREAQARLDAARDQMAARNFVNRATDEPIGQITFSGGVADVFAHEDPRAALRAADEALYRAKHAGRNRIEAG